MQLYMVILRYNEWPSMDNPSDNLNTSVDFSVLVPSVISMRSLHSFIEFERIIVTHAYTT